MRTARARVEMSETNGHGGRSDDASLALGNQARRRIGNKRWSKQVRRRDDLADRASVSRGIWD
jgi:hypothetical protein